MPTLFRAVGATGGIPRSLYARTSNAGYYMTLESPVGTDYQVPAGTIFKITRVIFMSPTANGGVLIGYGNDGVPDGGGAPTSSKGVIGDFAGGTAGPLICSVATTMYAVDIYAEIPALKYPCVRTPGAGAAVQVIGVEETA